MKRNPTVPDDAQGAFRATYGGDPPTLPIEFITTEECNRRAKSETADMDWVNAGRPRWIIPVLQHEKIICCVDVSYGHLYAWDDGQWYNDRNAIVTDAFAFVADYYGYSEGKLYIAAPEEVQPEEYQ